jgi:hypothetical protein
MTQRLSMPDVFGFFNPCAPSPVEREAGGSRDRQEASPAGGRLSLLDVFQFGPCTPSPVSSLTYSAVGLPEPTRRAPNPVARPREDAS